MTELRGLHLHVDAASGAAGDMMLGALLDLGVPIDIVGAALDAIGAGRARLKTAKVLKHGITATDVKVDTAGVIAGIAHAHAKSGQESTGAVPIDALAKLVERTKFDEHDHHDHDDHHRDHHHDHEHTHPLPTRHDHPHYHYSDIRARIVAAPLTEGTKKRALDIFDRIARAEAKLHGSTVEDVAFHEVGAIDSIVDIVGTAAALDWLSPASVSCAAVAMGHGTITCSHGVLPVPAPAALEVLREAQGVMADGGVARELCTPTGAAILSSAVTHWGPPPNGRPVGVGWGAGDADLADRANVLRVVTLARYVSSPDGVTKPGSPSTTDEIWQIDANVDDMSSELCAPALDAIFAAGAVDAWWTPIQMKKGRPALTISALATLDRRSAVITAILRETTTIGVRYAQLERTTLERSFVDVTTRFGVISMKIARDGNLVINAAPEYEACAKAAKANDVPVKVVYAAALAAFDRDE